MNHQLVKVRVLMRSLRIILTIIQGIEGPKNSSKENYTREVYNNNLSSYVYMYIVI